MEKNRGQQQPPRMSCILALSFLLILSPCRSELAQHHAEKYLKYYNVRHSVDQATKLLARVNISKDDLPSRLALMLLYSQDIEDAKYGPCLKCSLAAYSEMLLPSTPTDIFLFVKLEHMRQIVARPWVSVVPNLYVLLLNEGDDTSWKIPEWVRPEDKWSFGFSNEYRLMGHWRLSFMFPFAWELGYKYLMQGDSDTYIKTKIGYNLVTFVHDKDVYITNNRHISYEGRGFYMGLPELAQYWLASRSHGEGMYITAENASLVGIKGPIFKHCIPPDITGLHTANVGYAQEPGRLGWDAELMSGHYQIFSLDWWFSEDVQDFVQLVLRTGGHIERRWVDIATQAMIRHLFCPEEKIWTFDDVRIEHGHGIGMCTECGKDWLV